MNLGEKCFQVVEEPGYDVKVGATIDTQFISFKDFELPMRFLLLLLLLGPCAAQADVEIIPLRFRTVDQVIPVLRPLVEPGGALSGMQGQIIVRASAANIADLRRVLAIVDTQQRRLLISVRQDMEGSESGRGVGVSGTVGSDRFSISNESARDRANSGSGVNLQLGDGSARRDERARPRNGHGAVGRDAARRHVRELRLAALRLHVPDGRAVLERHAAARPHEGHRDRRGVH